MTNVLRGFGALLLMLVLAFLLRRADWPFVCGAKDAFWPAPPALQSRPTCASAA